MHWLICYDVTDDKRRARLRKLLKPRLVHVQQSVFEGSLPPQSLRLLTERALRAVDPARDSVRLYRLCSGCHGDVLLLGTSLFVPFGRQDVIV